MARSARRRPWRRVGASLRIRDDDPYEPIFGFRWIHNLVYSGLCWILFVSAPHYIGVREQGIDIIRAGSGGSNSPYLFAGKPVGFSESVVVVWVPSKGRYYIRLINVENAYGGSFFDPSGPHGIPVKRAALRASIKALLSEVPWATVVVLAEPETPMRRTIWALDQARLAWAPGVTIAVRFDCAEEERNTTLGHIFVKPLYVPRSRYDLRHELQCLDTRNDGEAY